MAEVVGIPVPQIEAEGMAVIRGIRIGIFLQIGFEQRMRLDDDAGTVGPLVPDLGTLVGDVAFCIVLAAVEVDGVGSHREEGHDEDVSCQVPQRLTSCNDLLVFDSGYLPDLFRSKDTLDRLLYHFLGHEHVEGTPDDHASVRGIIVAEPGLVEDGLDMLGVYVVHDSLLAEVFFEL